MRNRSTRQGASARLALVGAAVAVPVAGVAVVGGAATASAAPTITVSQQSGLKSGSTVSVTGKGLADKSLGTLVESNDTATSLGLPDPGPQPLTELYYLGIAVKQVPVSFHIGFTGSNPSLFSTSPTGTMSGSITLLTGNIDNTPYYNPPTQKSGVGATDSAGHDTHTDAALYPVPALPGQKDKNGNQATGAVTYGDKAGDSVTVPVYFGALTLSPVSGSTLPAAAPGSTYSEALTAGDGVAPFSFKVTGLPKGLKASAAGEISGKPGASDKAGTYAVKVSVADTKPGKATGTATYKLTVS